MELDWSEQAGLDGVGDEVREEAEQAHRSTVKVLTFVLSESGNDWGL